MNPMLNIAVRAARAAGDLIMRYAERVEDLPVTDKGRNDFVTDVDRGAEEQIKHIISRHYPSHGILAEESGGIEGEEYTWIIDPLDGTTNYLHGFPQFAVSIALAKADKLVAGVVFDPQRNELFTAVRGEGAQLNSRRIRVSKQRNLEGALLGTGIPYSTTKNLDSYLSMLRALAIDSAGIRRAGAASLDLAYVAAGRLDGFWEIGLKPWDMAAGVLLIQEAGGRVGDLTDGANYLWNGHIVAASPKVYSAMQAVLRPLVPSALHVNA